MEATFMNAEPGAILITGARGNIGGELVRLLLARDATVRAGVREPAVPGEVLFDFERPATIGPALQGVRSLFLLRPPAIANVERYLFPVVDRAREAGVEHIVFLSLLGAERIPWVPHRRVERYLEASGLAATFLRPSFFMQNLSTTHRADIRDRNEVFVPAGHGRTSFVDARDVAAAAEVCLLDPSHRGRAYQLTGAEALTYAEVAATLTEVLGRPIHYADASIPAFTLRMLAQGHPLPFVLVMVGIYTTARLGLAGAVTDDLGRLLVRPPTPFRRFAEDAATLWTQTGPHPASR